jgi:regulation of enolase protein 1 (concanavalin A-like superfamily)
MRLVRVAPLDPRRAWKAGPLLCAPSRAGLVATITSWSEGSADSDLH